MNLEIPDRTAALGTAWDEYLSETCATTDITDAELETFAADYELRGDENPPKKMAKMPAAASKYRYLCRWMARRGLMIMVK